MTEKSERYHQGLATRRSVLGASYVDAATKKSSTYDEPFQTAIRGSTRRRRTARRSTRRSRRC
jgi:hypothetical protein